MAPLSNGNTISMAYPDAGYTLSDQDAAEFEQLAAAFQQETAVEAQAAAHPESAKIEPIQPQDLSSSKQTFEEVQAALKRQEEMQRLAQLNNIGARLAAFRDRKAAK